MPAGLDLITHPMVLGQIDEVWIGSIGLGDALSARSGRYTSSKRKVPSAGNRSAWRTATMRGTGAIDAPREVRPRLEPVSGAPRERRRAARAHPLKNFGDVRGVMAASDEKVPMPPLPG